MSFCCRLFVVGSFVGSVYAVLFWERMEWSFLFYLFNLCMCAFADAELLTNTYGKSRWRLDKQSSK